MKKIPFLPGLIAIILMLAGCSDTDTGIFYSLEQEKKIADAELPNSITVYSIAVNADYYFISTGSVMRSASGKNTAWAIVPPPVITAGEQTLAAGVAYLGTHLYAGFYSSETLNSGLYRRSPSADLSTTWTSVPITGVTSTDALRIDNLIPAGSGNGMFVIGSMKVSGPRVNVIFFTPDGSTFVRADIPSPVPFIDADTNADTFGQGEFWFITPETLYRTDDFSETSSITATEKLASDKGDNFGGIIYNPERDSFFISTQDGYIFERAVGGSSWTTVDNTDSHTTDQVVRDNKVVAFNDFGYYAPENMLFVGTEQKGYYEITGVSASSMPAIRKSVFTAEGFTYSKLKNATVKVFGTGASDGGIILAGTAGNGLWKNIQDNTGRIWQQE